MTRYLSGTATAGDTPDSGDGLNQIEFAYPNRLAG